MANSVIGALRVMLGMDTAEFEKGADSASRSAARFQRDMNKLGGNLQKIGVGMTAALTAPLAAFGVSAIKAAQESADAFGQVQAALTSMGDASGRTAEQLQALAAAQMGKSLFDDDQILREVTATLLTFGSVAGAEFDRAQQAALDLSTRLGTDLSSATIQIGKALNDPVKGVTALAKAGIQFSVDQKAMIASLVETGDVAAAQRIILGELEKQFGGSAEAARKADPGAALKQSFATFQEEIGTKLLPLLPPLLDAITGILDAFTALPAPVQEGVIVVAALAAALGPVLIALGSIVTVAPALASAFGVIRIAALALMANPILLAFAGVIAGIFYVWKNWDTIEPILRSLYEGAKKWILKGLGYILDYIKNPIGAVTRAFKAMYIAVVGNSYVPDMVDGIEHEFNRLWAVMVDPAKAATASVTDAARAMASDVLGLLDRLFPEIAAARKQAEELALLDNAGLSDEARARARMRLLGGGRDRPEVSSNLLNQGPLAEVAQVEEAIQRMTGALDKGADKTKVQTVRIAETFADMAKNISGSLRGLADAIKGGSFFDIFDSVLGIVTTLGGAGVFGKGFQARLQSTPGFATGGAMRLGGVGGIDRNVLSLNGSPIARVSAGETMQIRPANDRGGAPAVVNNYYTLPSDEFWGRVDGRAGQVVGQAAPAIAKAGAREALGRLQQARGQALA